MGKKKKAAAVIGPAAVLAALFLRFGMGLPGLGGGLGLPGSNDGNTPGTVKEAAADAEETMSSTAASEESSAEETVSTASSETEEIKETEEEASDAEEESTEAFEEYVIEIRQDKYYLEGVEITSKKVEALLLDEHAVIRIDNNYGSQKAVSELKELFMQYNVPFVE